MAEKAKVPAIRFKGFTDAWEQRKLNEISEIIGGGTPSTSNPDYWDGDIDWYAPAEMEGQRYAVGSKRKITELGLQNSSAKVLPANKTVLFTSRAGIGKTAILCRSGATNQGFQSMVLSDGYNPYFIYSMGGSIKEKAESIASGSTFLEISGKMLGNLEIMVPEKAEQDAIAQYFENLDNLITLHQRKLLKLKNVKKAMLEKMFPKNGSNVPEIRFVGFTDAWEQRKWSETVDISTEMVDPKCGEYDDLPHVAPGNIESFTGRVLENVKTVKEENLISGKFHFYVGDVIYGKINPQLGKYAFAKYEGLTSADAYVLNSKNGLDQKFLFTLIQSDNFYRYTVSVSRRSGMPKINREELNSFAYSSPSTAEQTRIGELFLELDNLITLHQRKLEKLKNIKKACLEKMFV
jgi:type I restriction enzyme S subunit